MPGLEETENEFRFRVREPEQFDRFRRQEITNGVSILWGRLKSNPKKWEIQALRFDRSVFKTKAQVQKWLDDHPDLTKSLDSLFGNLAESSNIPQDDFITMEVAPKFFHRQASFKVLDEEARIIEGWANTNKIDRENEIFDYAEMQKAIEDFLKNPVMFFQHDASGESIGKWLETTVKETGLWAKGQVSKVGEFSNHVWEKIKAGELKGLSVGFLKGPAFQKVPVVVDGMAATLLKGYKIFEISLVYLPANQDSTFTIAGKSFKPEKESLIQIMGENPLADTAPGTNQNQAQDEQKKAFDQMAQEKAKIEAESKALKDQIAAQAKAMDAQAKALADLKAFVDEASKPQQKSQVPQDAQDDALAAPQEAWKGYDARLSVRQNFSNYRMAQQKGKQGGN